MSTLRLRRSLAELVKTMPPELRAWAEANPAEANARFKAALRRTGGLLARYSAKGAPKPGERGYRAPAPPCGEYDPAIVAGNTLQTALAYIEEPELYYAYERATEGSACGFYEYGEGGEEEEEENWPLEDLLGIPDSDCDGKPWDQEQREAIAVDTVRLVLETRADRAQWGTWSTGDYARGATRVETDMETMTLPWWAAVAIVTDFYAGPSQDRLVNVTKEQAADFASQHHSHLPKLNLRGVMYLLGIQRGPRLVAVATAGTPTGRWDRGDIDPGHVLEVTRIATDGTTRNATSRLLARLLDLLPASKRSPASGPELLVTYTLVGEPASPYKALREKGLRPVARTRGKAQAKGSARPGDPTSLGEVPKIRWEAGAGAGPARWDLLSAA